MKKGIFRKAGVAALSTAFAAVSFGVLPFAAPAAAQTGGGGGDVACSRISGPDRYATAAAIALETFAQSDVVFIARGDGTPRNPAGVPFDALAGSYGAGQFDAPILLTPGRGPVPQATKDAIQALGATTGVILGKEAAVNTAVEAELRTMLDNVRRVGGDDRYQTAALIAASNTAPGADGQTFTNAAGETAVFLANGEDARGGQDALAAGGPAWAEGIPVLLSEAASLNPNAASFIDSRNIERVYILGGTVAISQTTESQVTQLNGGTQVTRISGEDGAGTAVDLAVDVLIDELGWTTDHFNLANRSTAHLVDAVAGGPHAGAEQSMVLLADGSDTLGNDTEAFLDDLNDGVLDQHGGATVQRPTSADILGGRAAINDETAADACQRAGVPVEQPPGGTATALSLTPETDTNPVGSTHTVTATATNQQGGPAANGTLIRFEVYQRTGTSTYAAFTPFVGDVETSTNGTATFTYNGPANTGGNDEREDLIVSCVVSDVAQSCITSGTEPTVDPVTGRFNNLRQPGDTAGKVWTERRAAALSLTPETDVNRIGQEHTFTATVTDQFGSPLVGQAVTFELFRDTDFDGTFVNVADSNDNETTPAGRVSFTYTSTQVGLDRLVACVEGTDAGEECTSVPPTNDTTVNAFATQIDTTQTGTAIAFDPDDPVRDTADKEWVNPPTTDASTAQQASGEVVSDDVNSVDVFTDDKSRVIRFAKDSGDTYQVNGVNVTKTCYDTVETVGDRIAVNFVPGGTSVFNITANPDNSGGGCQNV